ncbi:MAG: very short patch repair endonuclease [Egibacteraceae bacterium]
MQEPSEPRPDWQPPPGSWASSEAARRTMRANRRRDTKPELAIRSAVHRMGLRYRVDVAPLPDRRRRADIVFPRQRVAVYVDGCFWHGCPEHGLVPRAHRDYWLEKIGRNRERDAETDAALREAGWMVVRVWEHEESTVAAARVAEVVNSCGARDAK